jgi:hypothetical protein
MENYYTEGKHVNTNFSVRNPWEKMINVISLIIIIIITSWFPGMVLTYFLNNFEMVLSLLLLLVCKSRVMPVIIGATGTISKSFRKYVSTIPGTRIPATLYSLGTWFVSGIYV